MNMKKWLLLSLIAGVVPLTMQAQDDMYFVPSKNKKSSVETVRPVSSYAPVRDTYYSGSNRDVDEYNRRGGSYYEALPGDSTSDIINFSGEVGVYPDSTQTEDYQLTRQMSRYDGYEPDAAFLAGYTAGRRDSWGWHSPWYFSSLYYPWYDPWYYDLWYDPWYYGYYGYRGWYYGWYDPWYYSYGWYYPHYTYYGGWYGYHGIGGHTYTGTTGTQNHGRINYGGARGISNGRSTAHSAGTFGGARSGSSSNRNTSTTASRTRTTATSNGVQTNQYGNFGGSRTTSTTSTTSSTRSTTPSSSGGSFGGSRSSGGGGSFGGGGGGGGRSGGGGSFGGRR